MCWSCCQTQASARRRLRCALPTVLYICCKRGQQHINAVCVGNCNWGPCPWD